MVKTRGLLGSLSFLLLFASRRDQFTGRIQERYGISRQKADRLAESFMSRNRKWWNLSNG